MVVEDSQISIAKMLIQQCVELVEAEPQQTFTLMRLKTDLEAANEALEAVQTVAIAPFAAGIEGVEVLVPPPSRYKTKSLAEIDDGEPSAYEVNNADSRSD